MGNLQLREGETLRIAAQFGFAADFLQFFSIVEDTDCACGAAMKSAAMTVVDDVRTSPIFCGKSTLPPMLQAGALAVVSIPIISRSRLLGMLSVHRHEPGIPDVGKLKRLQWLAGEAARILDGTAPALTLRGIEILARA